MGITKRKFSFPSLRLKTSSTVEAGAEYDIDSSPPYSPTPSEMERPNVHPQLLLELRQACTVLVNETNPPDPDEEPDHRETLRKFEEERQAKLAAQATQARIAEAKSQKAEARAEARAMKLASHSDNRAIEKARKEYARKVEAETRRMIAQEAEPDRRKAVERQAELRMGTNADVVQEQPRKEQPRRYSTRRPREDVPSSLARPEPRVAIPKGAAQASENHTVRRKASDTYRLTMEPLEPTHTKISSKAKGKQKEVDNPYQQQPSETGKATRLEFLPPVHATIVENSRNQQKEAEAPVLDQIRASMHERPKTSAAATVDYNGPSYGSSQSTTRSNTEYDNYGRPTSTAVTSAVFTPGDDNRTSYNRQSSADSYKRQTCDDVRRSGDPSAQARAWQEQKETLRRAQERYDNSGRAARPASKASKRSRIWGNESDSEYERPPSRTGSLSESIRSGISYYMRGRPSQESLRSGRSSASGFTRSDSRSSSVSRRSTSGWWRGSGLRRKGSWSSFRSMRPDHDEPSKLRKNGEPNLNRPLPALPGLDQYRETKTHIGQLMKGGGRGRKKEKTKRSDDAQNHPSQEQTQDPPPPQRHLKKDSISDPILRNSSMDRTLHRYRESKIMQEPSRPGASSSQSRHEHPLSPIVSPTRAARKPSSLSLHRSTSTSHRYSLPLKSPKLRRQSSSRSRRSGGGGGGGDNQTMKSPPPMIRGPSWQKELEEASYPRAMDVNKGDVGGGGGGGGGEREREREREVVVSSPGVTVLSEGEGMERGRDRDRKRKQDGGVGVGGEMGVGVGEWERKRGLKGRVGRIFGGREARVVQTGGRRSVAAAR